MNLKKLTVIICIIWIAIISFWVIKSEYILNTGREVLLKTVPVDPRDLLMGDYVILNYEISQIPEQYLYMVNKNYKNKEVYVVLKTDNNIAVIDKMLYKEPREPFYIKGKISKCNTANPFWKTGICINYGIESYYVKENTGMDLERNLRNGALVKIRIDRHGNAKVVGFV